MVVKSKVAFLDLVSLNSLADIQRRMPKVKVKLWHWTLEP